MPVLTRRKTLFALFVLLILIVLNIIISTLLITTVNTASLPTIDLTINTYTLTTDNATITYTLTIDNHNNFQTTLHHTTLTITNNNTELTRIPLPNITIPANTKTTTNTTQTITIHGNTTGTLTATLTSDIDIALLFIHKTLPLTFTIHASLDTLINQIHLPTITIHPEFGTFTNTTVNLTTTITITNPNPFTLTLHNTTITITNETNTTVASLPLSDAIITPHHNTTLYSTGFLTFTILNSDTLTIALHTTTSATIAGATKTMPLTNIITLAMPDLEQLLTHTAPFQLTLFIDLHRRPTGVQGEINLTVNNPSNIPFVAKDLRIDYYTARTAGNLTFLTHSDLPDTELSPHKLEVITGTIFFPNSMILPHLGGPLLPPRLLYATLSANITLTGVIKHALWVRIGNYADLRPFRLLPEE